MKRITYAALAALLLPLASCSDEFMDTESKTSFNNETAYANADLCQMALMGCYDGWQRTTCDEGFGMYLISGIASDECLTGAGVGDGRAQHIFNYFDMGWSSSDGDYLNTDWKNYYKGIYNCNVLIQQGAGKCGDREGLIMGQAKAIRAMLYFDLARLFGGVPLLTEPTEESLPRASVDEVFDLIFEDFKFAIANIPADFANGGNIDATNGLIGKFGAEAMMARAYLFYSGFYGKDSKNCSKADAVEAINDVVNNGGYDLEPNFKDLWMPACTEEAGVGEGKYAWKSSYAGKWYDGQDWKAGQGHLTKEYVLCQAHNSTGAYTNPPDGLVFQVFLGPRNTSKPPYAEGWGICVPSPKFVSDVLQGDPRCDPSVIDAKATGFESQDDFGKCLNDTYEYTGLFIKKFAPLMFSDKKREAEAFGLGEKHKNMTYYLDFPVVRFADVLLMQSELTGDATGFNRVHERAYKGESSSYSEENLRLERARELAFEGIRYWDLLRYSGQSSLKDSYASQQLTKHIDGVPVKNGGVDAVTSFKASNFEEKKGVFFLPLSQLQLSDGVLKQNDNWPGLGQ